MAAGPWSRTGEAAGRGAEKKEGLAGELLFLAERKEASGGRRETQREQTGHASVRRRASQDRGRNPGSLTPTQGPGSPATQTSTPSRDACGVPGLLGQDTARTPFGSLGRFGCDSGDPQ